MIENKKKNDFYGVAPATACVFIFATVNNVIYFAVTETVK